LSLQPLSCRRISRGTQQAVAAAAAAAAVPQLQQCAALLLMLLLNQRLSNLMFVWMEAAVR
jgi:hypothetical protein